MSVRRQKNKSSKKRSKFLFQTHRNRRFYCERRDKRNLKKKILSISFGQTSTISSKFLNFPNSLQSHSQPQPSPVTMEANKGPGSWFWENYNNTMEWQNRHFTAFWRARCAALEAENVYLYNCLDMIKQQTPTALQNIGMLSSFARTSVKKEMADIEGDSMPVTCSGENSASADMQYREDHKDDGSEGEEFVFEVNEEMLAFLEQSAKHKLELKKQREAERKEEEDAEKESKELKLKFPKESMQQRRDEMAQIYGAASSMILSMETAMQLSFDRFNDRHQPKHWPNIPLKL